MEADVCNRREGIEWFPRKLWRTGLKARHEEAEGFVLWHALDDGDVDEAFLSPGRRQRGTAVSRWLEAVAAIRELAESSEARPMAAGVSVASRGSEALADATPAPGPGPYPEQREAGGFAYKAPRASQALILLTGLRALRLRPCSGAVFAPCTCGRSAVRSSTTSRTGLRLLEGLCDETLMLARKSLTLASHFQDKNLKQDWPDRPDLVSSEIFSSSLFQLPGFSRRKFWRPGGG